MIKYARGGAVHHTELYVRSFTHYFSEFGSIKKKTELHLKPLNGHLPCFDACWKRKNEAIFKSVCDRHTHRRSNYFNPRAGMLRVNKRTCKLALKHSKTPTPH